MKRIAIFSPAVFCFVASGCAAFLPPKPKIYNVTIAPKLETVPSRRLIKSDIKIVLQNNIVNDFKLERGNEMVLIEVTNFRDSIEKTVKDMLDPQFDDVTVETKETGEGLELAILGADYPDPIDVLAFHYALMHNGKLIYEAKGKTEPLSQMLKATASTWQDQTSKVTLEILESNICSMAEQMRDDLLINEKLNEFWSKL